jgi:hypothetical protein
MQNNNSFKSINSKKDMAVKEVIYSREFIGVSSPGFPFSPYNISEEDKRIRQEAETNFSGEQSKEGMKGFDRTFMYYFKFEGNPINEEKYIAKAFIKRLGDKISLEGDVSDLERFLYGKGFRLEN